jgi:hypothetical protein
MIKELRNLGIEELDARCTMQDARCKMQDEGWAIQDGVRMDLAS